MSAKRYAVIRTNHNVEGAPENQCGAAVKTPAKAEALKARMRAQQERGSSCAFRIVTITAR